MAALQTVACIGGDGKECGCGACSADDRKRVWPRRASGSDDERARLRPVQHTYTACSVMPPREGEDRMGKGVREPLGDKSTPRRLQPGDKVSARYHGHQQHHFYPATALLQNPSGSWRIQYDDNKEEEDMFVLPAAGTHPLIMHLDGTYVQLTSLDRQGRGLQVPDLAAEAPAPAPAPSRKRKVDHGGFEFMRLDPPAADAVDDRDDLPKRMHFMYKELQVVQGKQVATPKYVSLDEIVRDPNPPSARLHQRALYDFLGQLYTAPPVSASNMKHLLGKEAMDGWRAQEKERVQRNFDVFKRAQDQEEAKRGRKRQGKAAGR